MENTKYGRRREGRWTPIRAKAQDTRANPNSWETHLVRKSWDIGLLRALSLQIMMMMMMMTGYKLNVLHWLPVRQRIQYRVASLVWRCQLGLALAYLMDLCRSVSGGPGVADPFALLRGEFWWSRLPVQRLCRTAHSLWRALGFGMISLRNCASSLDYVRIHF